METQTKQSNDNLSKMAQSSNTATKKDQCFPWLVKLPFITQSKRDISSTKQADRLVEKERVNFFIIHHSTIDVCVQQHKKGTNSRRNNIVTEDLYNSPTMAA